MSATTILTVLAGLVAAAAAAIYFFGIPPEAKRAMEKQALKTMGENKLSYMAKDSIDKIPSSDQEDVKNLKKGLGNAVGGIVNNPIGETGGETADRLTSPLTGR